MQINRFHSWKDSKGRWCLWRHWLHRQYFLPWQRNSLFPQRLFSRLPGSRSSEIQIAPLFWFCGLSYTRDDRSVIILNSEFNLRNGPNVVAGEPVLKDSPWTIADSIKLVNVFDDRKARNDDRSA